MSSRGHVDVNERRLRPIYDSLDYGSNKKALQEADKVLKKQKDFQCAKVLKGLALLRLGRSEECESLLKEVHQQSPTEEATLQALLICYREMNRFELIAEMYANAQKLKPDSEDILSALFMAYVRLSDYKKQQQTAMMLHRLCPQKNPYYFWAVMSIVMQAHVADDKLAQAMFLPLAERMTQKYVSDDKIEAEAEVRMFLLILEQRGKYKEALDVIGGPLGEKLNNELHFKETKSAELLTRLERWPEMNTAYRELLIKEPDHWKFYMEYFRSVFALQDANWKPNEDDSSAPCVDFTEEMVRVFLETQVETATQAQRPFRGPFLARLELCRQLQQRSADKALDRESVLEYLSQYFARFGDKPCCYSDVKTYIRLLEREDQIQFLKGRQDNSGLGDDNSVSLPQDAKSMQRHLTLLQLAHVCGHHDDYSKEEKEAFVGELLKHYTNGIQFGENLLSTDLQYSDPYLQLAVHVLYDLWQESGESRFLWQAVLLLKTGLKKSPSSFQLKLLLIKLYATVGAFGPCPALYDSMEIKHIQHDSIGYVIVNHMSRLGFLASACLLYNAMLAFFNVNHKDTTEHLIMSYKFGSFSKVQEFVDFRTRLQNSLQFASATTERLLLDLILETPSHQRTEELVSYMDVDPEKDRTVWQDLRDNRDLYVMSVWEPPDRSLTEETKRLSFREEVAWLKVRQLLVHCLSAAVRLGERGGGKGGGGGDKAGAAAATTTPAAAAGNSNNVDNGQSASQDDHVLRDLVTQLREQLVEARGVESPRYLLMGPCRTRLSPYLALGLGDLLCEAFDLLAYVYRLTQDGLEKSDEKIEESMQKQFTGKISDLIEKHKCPFVTHQSATHQLNPTVLENLVLIAETLGFLTLILGAIHKLLRPIKQALMKRNKKKKDSVLTLPPSLCNFRVLVCGLEGCMDSLNATMKEAQEGTLADKLAALQLDDCFHTVQIEAETVSSMWKSVEDSYQLASKETTALLQIKKSYLASLKL